MPRWFKRSNSLPRAVTPWHPAPLPPGHRLRWPPSPPCYACSFCACDAGDSPPPRSHVACCGGEERGEERAVRACISTAPPQNRPEHTDSTARTRTEGFDLEETSASERLRAPRCQGKAFWFLWGDLIPRATEPRAGNAKCLRWLLPTACCISTRCRQAAHWTDCCHYHFWVVFIYLLNIKNISVPFPILREL